MTMLQVPDGVLEVLATNCPGPDATLNCVVVRAATTIANRAEAETEAHINVAEKDSVVTVSLRRHAVKQAHTFSFIVDSNQALPWVNTMSKGLAIEQTAFLIPIDQTKNISPDEIARQIERERDEQQQQQKSQVVAELTVTRISKRHSEPSKEEQLATANTYREAGNDLFKSAQNFKDYRKVHAAYTRALNFGPVDDEKLRIALRSNMAILSLRTTDYSYTLIDTDAAEAMLNRNEELENDFRAKLIFRRASALFKMDFLIRALNDINEAARLKPDDKFIIKEQNRFQTCIAVTLEKRRKEFAEVYNVMVQSLIFKNPLLV